MTGPVFRHGELPLVILALLEQRPMRGHEVMAELGRLFAPEYHASAGAVYPALSSLREQGLITEVSVLGVHAYRPTKRGTSALSAGSYVLSGVEARTGKGLQNLGSVKVLVERFAGRILATEGRVSPRAVADILERTDPESNGSLPARAPRRPKGNRTQPYHCMSHMT